MIQIADFGARYNSSTLGRFMTPDWSAQAEPVPYAKLDNPQSLNLYSYVLNNPVSTADKDGHASIPCPACAIGAAIGSTLVYGVDFYYRIKQFNAERIWLNQDQTMVQFAWNHPNSRIDLGALIHEEQVIAYKLAPSTLVKAGSDTLAILEGAGLTSSSGATTEDGQHAEKDIGTIVKTSSSAIKKVTVPRSQPPDARASRTRGVPAQESGLQAPKGGLQ